MRSRLTTADRVVLLLALVPYLEEHGPTTVAELAVAFDVEPQLLRRLVRFLGTAGVPGETLQYQHEDLFDIDWTALEEHDVVSLTRVVAVDDTPRFAPAETAALIAGLQALTTVLPEGDAELAGSLQAKLGAVIGADERPAQLTVTAEPQDAQLPELVAALDSGRRLAFTYRDANGAQTARTVDPLHITQGSDSWYLRAYCHDRAAERFFRVDRMSELRVLSQRSTRREFGQSAEERHAASEAAITVVARVRETALHRIQGFAPEVSAEAAPGWLRVRLHLGHPDTAAALVQQAPGEVVVESPDSARAAVRSWAERALAHYDA